MNAWDELERRIEDASAAIDNVDSCEFGKVGKLLDKIGVDIAAAAKLVADLRAEQFRNAQ